MADSTQGTPANGNGLSLDLANKKLGLTGPNIALILLIIIIGVVAWLRTGAINETLKAGQNQLAATEVRVQTRVSELVGRIDKVLEDLAALRAQGVLGQEHTGRLDEWVQEVVRRQDVMNFNILHPDRAVPLQAPLPSDERSPERGR